MTDNRPSLLFACSTRGDQKKGWREGFIMAGNKINKYWRERYSYLPLGCFYENDYNVTNVNKWNHECTHENCAKQKFK